MKRKNGTGSMTFDKTANRIVARIRINGKIHKKTFHRGQQHVAKAWLSEMASSPCGIYSVGRWMEEYMKTFRKPFLRPRSYERVEQAQAHWKPIYDIPLNQLLPSDVQKIINDMVIAGLSASTIKKSHDLLKSAYQQAFAEGIVKTNPAAAVKRPKQQKKQIEIFNRREIGKIFHALRQIQNNKRNTSQRHDFILFFRLLLTTGTRVSELLALSWENVGDDSIIIKGSKEMDSIRISETKTTAGNRKIPLLSPKTKKMLHHHRKKSGFVFATKNNTPMSYQRVFLTWENVRKKTGITKTIHCFRHTCISYLILKYPIAYVSAFAGHANPAITLQIYTHITGQI